MSENSAMNPSPLTERLSRRTKLFYGVGDTGFSLTSTLLGAYFAIFLTDVVGIAPGIAAAAIFIGRSWDYINDPLIGHISDRTRTRWGRRRPFLLFGAIPYALVFMLLWWRPPWTNNVALAVYYAAAYVVFDTAATFVYMPYFALTPELTSDYDERTALTSYRMFFSILGSLISFTLPLVIVGSFTPQNTPRVLTMGIIFGVTAALAVLITFLGTRERAVFMTQAQPGLKQSLRAAKNNRAFRFSLGIFLCTWVVVSIVQASLLYFIKYVIQREAQSDLIMGLIFVTAIVALPFWEWASRHKSKQWAYIVGIAFWAVMQLVLITVNANTALPLIYLLCVMAGIGVSAAHVLPWSLIPDAVEWGEWETGERHEGMFYSLITLSEKVASSIAVPLALLLLDVTGYIPNAVQQPASALWGIRLIMGPIPAALLGLGIVLAFKYPLTRARYAQLVQDLEQRRLQSVD
ncbi:MAG TPA: glycoside-pentoside-hexuronide (GPH):cation symporter [Anaerolineae bacterium]|mgnify:CR=1 FL=1|nr:glycoside-pentoside-hexuronide (GPH):cation symporter [Anaerolineae bacterium]HQH38650.1 glycoside-pentoside-hexuronide (GPH):cation symporter [Anaerolineae bacterium]